MTPIGFDWHEAVGERRSLRSVGASERLWGRCAATRAVGGDRGFRIRFSPAESRTNLINATDLARMTRTNLGGSN
jgi:hypothetical protein